MTGSRTRVKICGITRLDDALMAESLGADALGFVFVPASKRYIAPEAALTIVEQLNAFTVVTGLFLEAPQSDVAHVLSLIPHLLPQFHGRERGDYCDSFGRPYIKALGVGSDMPSEKELSQYRHASGFLFDSNEPGALGGTGHAFDWTRLDDKGRRSSSCPLILAGGLNSGNVQRAIEMVKPYAVDVSSGVESAKGVKDTQAMQSFMRGVMRADAANLLAPVAMTNQN